MKKLDTFALKMLGILTMFVDHVGYIFFPEARILRIIGRLAFPIFTYLLAEGFFYTRDVKKYLFRLGLFAVVSEIPFDLAFQGELLELSHQNVFFTLFFGVLMLWLMSKAKYMLLQYGVVIAMILVCRLLNTDYSSVGILLIFVFSVFRERKIEKLLLAGLVFLGMTGGIQWCAVLALPLIALHNGEQGRKMKWFFYLFYPVHLMVLYLINLVV